MRDVFRPLVKGRTLVAIATHTLHHDLERGRTLTIYSLHFALMQNEAKNQEKSMLSAHYASTPLSDQLTHTR